MNCKPLILAVLAGSVLSACGPTPEELYAEANQLFIKNQYKEALPLYEKLYLKNNDVYTSFRRLLNKEYKTLIKKFIAPKSNFWKKFPKIIIENLFKY